jgi:hypothetical protein
MRITNELKSPTGNLQDNTIIPQQLMLPAEHQELPLIILYLFILYIILFLIAGNSNGETSENSCTLDTNKAISLSR